MSGRGGAWMRAAPAALLGISLACLIAFAFVPSVIALYEARGSPPVNVNAASLSLAALIANIVVLVLIVAVGPRTSGTRDE